MPHLDCRPQSEPDSTERVAGNLACCWAYDEFGARPALEMRVPIMENCDTLRGLRYPMQTAPLSWLLGVKR